MSTERPDPLAPPDWYTEDVPDYYPSKPADPPLTLGVRNTPDWVPSTTDTFCGANRQEPTSPPVCKAERDYIFTLGDVAEHICRIDLCAAHAMDALRRLATGQQARCNSCHNKMRLERIEDTEGNEVKASDIKAPVSEKMATFIQNQLDRLNRDRF